MKQKRRKANLAGSRSEMIAALFLMAKGYVVLARRHKTPVGEIDLIVRNKTRLAFVEVKRRAIERDALSAVSPRQQQRIKRAADYWLANQNTPPTSEIGFDIVTITPWKLPRHHKDAFSHTRY